MPTHTKNIYISHLMSQYTIIHDLKNRLYAVTLSQSKQAIFSYKTDPTVAFFSEEINKKTLEKWIRQEVMDSKKTTRAQVKMLEEIWREQINIDVEGVNEFKRDLGIEDIQ